MHRDAPGRARDPVRPARHRPWRRLVGVLPRTGGSERRVVFLRSAVLGVRQGTTGRVGPGVGDGAQEVRRQHARGHPVPGPGGGGGGGRGGRGGGDLPGGDRGKVRHFDADPAGAGRMRGYPHGHVLRDNRATQRREVLLRGRRGGRVAIVSREFPFHVCRRARRVRLHGAGRTSLRAFPGSITRSVPARAVPSLPAVSTGRSKLAAAAGDGRFTGSHARRGRRRGRRRRDRSKPD